MHARYNPEFGICNRSLALQLLFQRGEFPHLLIALPHWSR